MSRTALESKMPRQKKLANRPWIFMAVYAIVFLCATLDSMAVIVQRPDYPMPFETSLAHRYSHVNVAFRRGNLSKYREQVQAQNRKAWQQTACPWEEGRHSGFWLGMSNTHTSLEFAQSHIRSQESWRVLQRLANKHFIFVGDSLQRQFAQAFMCYLKEITFVVKDGSHWGSWPNGDETSCPNARDSTINRHCFMLDESSVEFRNGVTVTYRKRTTETLPANAIHSSDDSEDTIFVFSQPRLKPCDQDCWKALGKLRISRATVIMKEYSIQHFLNPGTDGQYRLGQNGQRCGAVAQDPIERVQEVTVGIPIVQSKGRNWHVLRTYEEIDKPSWMMHSAEVPIGLDCTHWLLPGVPDVWVSKLMKLLLQ